MVFELIINPYQAKHAPWKLFFVGMIYSSLAVILSLFIFREYASLVMIFLTVLASVQIIHAAIRSEEKKDFLGLDERTLIKSHGRVIAFFMFLFLGFMVSYSAWYVFLPEDTADSLFSTQKSEILGVQLSSATGNAVSTTAILSRIFLNNLWVMVFSLIFAFFYGVGAIFILTWNASVLGAAVGMFAKETVSAGIISSMALGLARYSIHGLPEMAAYFTAGLAGSIISVAVIRHDFATDKFRLVLRDSVDLVVLSVGMLFVAALLEVYLTPLFF